MNHEPLRLLLVEDNPGDARLLREMLAESSVRTEEVRHVAGLGEALAALQAEEWDLVLLDLALPDSAGIETFDRVHADHPDVPVVVLSGLDDEEVAINAVERGAQDYLAKNQLSAPVLARAVRYAITRHEAHSRALRLAQGEREGGVLAFIGAKGGVGTSTLALNIASNLTLKDKSVVVVELRPYPGTFAAQLDAEPVQDLSDICALEPSEITPDALRKGLFTLPSGLRVLFGPRGGADPLAPPVEVVGALIDTLDRMFDHVVLDLPPMPSELSRAALQEAWRVALVTEPEPTSVHSGRLKLGLLRSWGITGQFIGALVVNRVALPTGFNIEAVREGLGCPVLGVVPPAPEDCMVALQAGTPVVLLRPESVISVRLNELTDAIMAEAVVPAVP